MGDANPLLAIWDTLQACDLDHIIVSTLPAGISRWIKLDLPSRVEGAFGLPVTHIVAQPEHRAAGTLGAGNG